ncbi:MAG TPA: prephenate dehydrogenase/arogenate dehydrogenase family protein [Thermoanaerobacterium sp.]|nr:prephenate dehydrogenase/arogenate dehydrogenase family protein [Thermoanaerobacterium sp.]
MIKKVAIIGLGLIGGSLAKAIRRYTDLNIIGVDVKDDYIDEALREGIINEGFKKIDRPIDADVVFVCTPVGVVINCIEEMLPHLKDGCVITDVGSTKKTIMDAVKGILPKDKFFIGGHPMAGSEKCGFYSSNSELFFGSNYFIIPDEKTPDNVVEIFIDEIIKKIGANPILVDSYSHDKIVGIVSHVPHILSAALANFAYREDADAIKFAAGGFKDSTRISMSQTEMWKDIILNNKDVIKKLIIDYENLLNEFLFSLDCDDIKSLCEFFDSAREIRKSIAS